MEASFRGQNVAVTGGFSGIGLATVVTLARLGASVYVIDHLPSTPEELVEIPNVHCTPGGDITDSVSCETFIESIPGRLDSLVNCAGISPPEGKLPSLALYRRVLDVNVGGTWNMGYAAIRRMNEQESLTCREREGVFSAVPKKVGRGSIVNVSSGSGLAGRPNRAAYCASKHAVVGLTRAWALDWPQIRVNVVCPGPTDTSLMHNLAEDDMSHSEWVDSVVSAIPMGRLGAPTDVADMITFLLSNASSFVTGQVMKVNGGYD